MKKLITQFAFTSLATTMLLSSGCIEKEQINLQRYKEPPSPKLYPLAREFTKSKEGWGIWCDSLTMECDTDKTMFINVPQ